MMEFIDNVSSYENVVSPEEDSGYENHVHKLPSEEELAGVALEWEYLADILDRLFLWVYSVSCIGITLGVMVIGLIAY